MKHLQLPKSKEFRFYINVVLIAAWISFYHFWGYKFWYILYWYLFNLFGAEVLDHTSNFINKLLYFIPPILITIYIWYRRIQLRPKITRSNSAREYGDPEFIEDLILKMEYLEMKERYKSDLEE